MNNANGIKNNYVLKKIKAGHVYSKTIYKEWAISKTNRRRLSIGKSLSQIKRPGGKVGWQYAGHGENSKSEGSLEMICM